MFVLFCVLKGSKIIPSYILYYTQDTQYTRLKKIYIVLSIILLITYSRYLNHYLLFTVNITWYTDSHGYISMCKLTMFFSKTNTYTNV